MYCVYVLRNKSGVLYRGLTNNLKRRIDEHNRNKNIGTRGKGPWELVYSEKHANRKEARARERYFKSGSGRELLKQIIPR